MISQRETPASGETSTTPTYCGGTGDDTSGTGPRADGRIDVLIGKTPAISTGDTGLCKRHRRLTPPTPTCCTGTGRHRQRHRRYRTKNFGRIDGLIDRNKVKGKDPWWIRLAPYKFVLEGSAGRQTSGSRLIVDLF